MEKEFVPYKLAIKLKELGFDEKCIYYFRKNNKNEFILFQNDLGECYVNADFDKVLVWDEYLENPQCSAPLYQQAFRWFREEHGLFGNPDISNFENKTYGYAVTTLNHPHYLFNAHSFSSMEEAELACLDKLIEILTKQQEL